MIEILSDRLGIAAGTELYRKEILARNVPCIHLYQTTGKFARQFRNRGLINDDIVDNISREQVERECFTIGLRAGKQGAIQHGSIITIGKTSDNQVLTFLNGSSGHPL